MPIIRFVDLESLAIRLSRSENLPVLPQVVGQVLKLAEDPTATPRSLEAIIERDPAITAKILRVANSAYYGFHQIPSIGRAISVLGTNVIRSLIVAVAYQQVIATRQVAAHFNKLDFWHHSLAAATAARILAKLKLPVKAEELYSAAMLHDVGMLVLERFATNEFDSVVHYAQSERIPIHVAEQEQYKFDHAAVGGLLADRWGLPATIRAAIEFHHNLPAVDPQFLDTTADISAANTIAHQCGYSNNAPGLDVQFEPEAIEYLGLPTEQLDVIKSVVQQEIEKAEDAFHMKPAA